MKKLWVIVPACLFIMWSVSCQKEIPDILNLTDTTVTGNTFNDSFRIIQSRYESGTDIWITNIEYDTTGRKINLYNDDSTTSNPYDELAQQYSYSTDGYLLSLETFQSQNFDAYKVTFERDASKRLTRLIRTTTLKTDTFLFKYQASGANTIVYSIHNDSTVVKNQEWVTYNSNNQYTSIITTQRNATTGNVGNKTVATYLYNADGTMQLEKHADTSFSSPLMVKNNTLNFTNYEANTPPVFSNLTKIVLGKDWYLYDLQYEGHPFFMMLANAPVQPDFTRHYEEEIFYGLAKPLKAAQVSFTQPFVQQDSWLWNNTKDSKGRITVIEQKINNVVTDRWKLKYAL